MNKDIEGDFQICISVPLSKSYHILLWETKTTIVKRFSYSCLWIPKRKKMVYFIKLIVAFSKTSQTTERRYRYWVTTEMCIPFPLPSQVCLLMLFFKYLSKTNPFFQLPQKKSKLLWQASHRNTAQTSFMSLADIY